MIRLTFLLIAGLYFALQVGGQDNGQMRFGLIEAEKEAAMAAAAKAQAKTLPTVQTTTAVIEAAFVPVKPLIALNPAPKVETVTQPVAAETVAAPEPDAAVQVLYVTGRSVNVRGGPSTANEVVGRLTRGEAVTVVEMDDNGWARIRMEGDGVEGFMSMDFLTDVAP